MTLARRNKYFGKWKQAEHDFEYLNKGRKITDKSSSIAKQKALKKEAIAAKKENKAKLDLDNAVTSQEKSAATAAIKEAREEKQAASVEFKKSIIKEEKEKESEDLDAASATDAEREAIRKVKKY